MKLKGTETEKNLLTAFAGESQARNRYLRYAKAAKKDGYQYIAVALAKSNQGGKWLSDLIVAVDNLIANTATD